MRKFLTGITITLVLASTSLVLATQKEEQGGRPLTERYWSGRGARAWRCRR